MYTLHVSEHTHTYFLYHEHKEQRGPPKWPPDREDLDTSNKTKLPYFMQQLKGR